MELVARGGTSMVTLECNDCGREEHFTSIEDANIQGWQFDEYVWLCPFCLNPKDVIDSDDDTGEDSLL